MPAVRTELMTCTSHGSAQLWLNRCANSAVPKCHQPLCCLQRSSHGGSMSRRAAAAQRAHSPCLHAPIVRSAASSEYSESPLFSLSTVGLFSACSAIDRSAVRQYRYTGDRSHASQPAGLLLSVSECADLPAAHSCTSTLRHSTHVPYASSLNAPFADLSIFVEKCSITPAAPSIAVS